MAKLIMAILLTSLTLGVMKFGTAQPSDSKTGAAWRVINVSQLNNLSGNVVQTLFTPAATGMFRATIYGQIPPAFTNGSLCPALIYTNGLGVQQFVESTTCNTFSGNLDFGWVLPFQPMGGTAVTFETLVSDPSFFYNYVITLEHLVATP